MVKRLFIARDIVVKRTSREPVRSGAYLCHLAAKKRGLCAASLTLAVFSEQRLTFTLSGEGAVHTVVVNGWLVVVMVVVVTVKWWW